MNRVYTKKLSLFEIISLAWDVVKNCAPQLLTLSLIFAIYTIGLKILADKKIEGVLKSTGLFSTLILLHLLFFSAFIAVNCAKIVKAYTKTGKSLSLTDSLKQSIQKIWAIISTHLVIYGIYTGITAASLLVVIFCNTVFNVILPTSLKSFFQNPISALVTILLLFAFVIGIIVGSIYLTFTFQAVALDNKKNISALKQSYEIVSGNWFKTVLLFIITGAPLGLSSIILKNNFLVLLMIYILGATFSTTAQTLLYLNLQAQK